MISLDVKTESNSSSPLNLGTSDSKEEPKQSFAELLKGVKNIKGESQDTTKNIVDTKKGETFKDDNLILAIDAKESETSTNKSDVKTNSLLSLLENKDSSTDGSLEINPKLSENLTQKELKTLISDSKNYLKNQITQSDGYKQAQVKELPNTLDGLTKAAKTFGIDVSKITLEEVSPKTKNLLDTNSKILTQTDTKSINLDKELQVKNPQLKEELNAKQNIVQKDPNESSSKSTLKDALNVVDKKTQTLETKTPVSRENQNINAREIQENKTPATDTAKTSILKDSSQTTNSITQPLTQDKQIKVNDKQEKNKTNEALKTLLSGEKSQTDTSVLASLGAEISKATTSSSSGGISSLEQMLSNSDSDEDKNSLNSLLSNTKTETATVQKADSFEVKLNEAKQMIKYLSDDVKNAINDYKSPFTRIKVQLNPQKLGDVDLTVVQRGNNLHVNLSSNNAAINTLAMNMNELRTQLQNTGINNATFNFNSQDNNGQNASQQQQQNRQNEQNAQEQYNYFENEEQNEEILSSLEIVVPRYI